MTNQTDKNFHSLLWLTDIHADKKDSKEIEKFISSISTYSVDLICITGDIAEGNKTLNFLNNLFFQVQKPIAFVLGNHDFFENSIQVFQTELASQLKNFYYLPNTNGIQLNQHTFLLGIDNWYNLNDHDYSQVEIIPDDFHAIRDLQQLSSLELIAFFEQKAEEAIQQLRLKLDYAQTLNIKKLYLALHVPPYTPSCYFEDAFLKNEPWKYYWSCAPIGQFINEYASKHPDIDITILSGHTHKPAIYRPLNNVKSYIGTPSDLQSVGVKFML